MSRLTRDGTTEPVSRDQILRRERGQGNIHFPCSADQEQDWQPDPVDPYSTTTTYVMAIHTKMQFSSGESSLDLKQNLDPRYKTLFYKMVSSLVCTLLRFVSLMVAYGLLLSRLFVNK